MVKAYLLFSDRADKKTKTGFICQYDKLEIDEIINHQREIYFEYCKTTFPLTKFNVYIVIEKNGCYESFYII